MSTTELKQEEARTEVPAFRWVRECRGSISAGFIRNVVETYATRMCLLGVTLATTIVVARLLGPQGRGLFAVAAAVGALGIQFGNLGLHTSNVYYAARNPETLPLLVGNTLFVGLGLGSVLACLAGAVFVSLPSLISLRGSLLFLGLMWIPVGLTYLLIQDLLLGTHSVRKYNILEIINKTAPLVLMCGLALTGFISVATFFATTILATAACSVWGLLWLKKKCSFQPRVSFQTFRDGFRLAVKAYLITLFSFLIFRADLFLVQHMLGAEQAGYYSIASSMADPVWMLAMVVGTILLPRLSAISDLERKLKVTKRAVLGITFALLPILLLASALAGPAIHLLFGSAFLPAKAAFMLLMPGMLFLGIEAVAMQFLNSIGCPRRAVWVMGLCALLNVVVNLWAIPHYGIAGASVVSSVTYFLASACVLWLIRQVHRSLARQVQTVLG